MTTSNAATQPMLNALSLDVEDWYQSVTVRSDDWKTREKRLEQGLVYFLDQLKARNVKATFFILGECARDYPELIRRIGEEGHEIGTHLDSHSGVYNLSLKEFEEELTTSMALLEEVTGCPVVGHRAPFFSITKASYQALGIMVKHGLKFDASIYPGTNYRYGIDGSPQHPYIVEEFGIPEFPVSVRKVLGQQLGIGGAYFRIMPYSWTKASIEAFNKAGMPAGVYLHPWEFDPDHPNVKMGGRLGKITHYWNLRSTRPRFEQLLADFQFAPIGEVLAALPDLPTHSALPAA